MNIRQFNPYARELEMYLLDLFEGRIGAKALAASPARLRENWRRASPATRPATNASRSGPRGAIHSA